eukprot:7786969-Lingulodinium_polyedra.AAC.1
MLREALAATTQPCRRCDYWHAEMEQQCASRQTLRNYAAYGQIPRERMQSTKKWKPNLRA